MNIVRLFPMVLAGTLLLSVSAQAGVYTATLNGLQEVPANASTGTGFITVTLVGNSLTVAENFTGLIGGSAAAAHIHCCVPPGTNAIVAVPFTGFPAATSGTYNNTFDLTLSATYNPAFVTANGNTVASAEAALIAGLTAGTAYANIHNATFGGGEIRGNLREIPEPSTVILLLSGMLAFGGLASRKNRRA